ncbi:Oidioi.mRNA.OKI2018_I69.chr2.g4976.t1.cds [Oikopleura dioica]|uniref:Oidioi.mRNA.OKI2018_I69.chr2.g4976.t1.cds n=1 Tax=Oikopleura dioica TaxID=34765 RepID=A0ABN7SYY4_OIKDI|nr:Oidioi.mRNA.OKI2018_I69.chr2.g4976.t1.cds [Oikopleura dioica]
MGFLDYFKETLSNCINRDAEKWIEENYQDVSIDKILKVQFSIRLAALAYYSNHFACLDSVSLEKNKNDFSKLLPEKMIGTELDKSSMISLLKRFEIFDFEAIRDDRTGSDAILIFAKDKPVDNVEGKTYAIVTVCGTFELQDVWQDIKISQVQFEETEARAHSGFYECFQALKPGVESFLDKTVAEKTVDEILIVGHSLGGAVASLLGASLAPKYEGENFRVVSVGAPKIGNKALQDLFKERVKKHVRVRLTSDLIVRMPNLLYWFRKAFF